MKKILFPKTQNKRSIKKLFKEESRIKLIKKLDSLVSAYIKKKAKGKCARCGQIRKNMGTSHFWSRRYLGTRWEEENLDWMCWLPCHFTAEKEKQGWYQDYMISKLGKDRYEILKVKALTVTHYSKVDIKLLIQYYETKRP